MSEQQSEPTSGETGTIGTGPAAPDMSAAKAPVTAAASVEVESPRLAPEQEETSPGPDAPKAEMPKVEASKVEPAAEAPAVEAAKPETVNRRLHLALVRSGHPFPHPFLRPGI